MQQENNSIGPFKAMGKVLNTVGTTANVLDDTITQTGNVLSTSLQGVNVITAGGLKALEIITAGALEDLKTDNVVDTAHRKVRAAQAKLEAKKILNELK